MKLLPILFLLLAPIAQAAENQPLEQDETSALLARLASSRRDSSSQSDFREEKNISMMKKTIVETGTIAFLPPNMFRREVPGKSLTLCDGRTLWLYYPAFQEAEKYQLSSNRMLRESLAAMTAGLGLQDVSRNYTVKAWRIGPGYRLILTPRSSALRKSVAQITLDLNAGLTADRMEISSPGGEKSITTFTNERKARLSPEDFVFHPPAGVTITEPFGN